MHRIKLRKKVIWFIAILLLVWLIWPYWQVEKLSNKYGKYFEERYKETGFYRDASYMKPRVVRYRNEKARISTDYKPIRWDMEDERENVAVVFYADRLYITFYYKDGAWIRESWGELLQLKGMQMFGQCI